MKVGMQISGIQRILMGLTRETEISKFGLIQFTPPETGCNLILTSPETFSTKGSSAA